MPRAVVLNTASKKDTTGGTFADTLTANSGDSLAIPNLQSGQGKIMRMWGIDSASVMELALTAGRVESIHDPQFGIRFNTSVLAFGGAGKASAFPLIEPPNYIDVFTGDTLTMTVTTTANDDVVVSWLTEYQDLPGVQASFANWETVKANRFTEIGVRCAPVASATEGAYGTARAINADDTRWTGGRWYAILGFTVQIPCTTVSFKGPMWGNFRFGAPGGAAPFAGTDNYFVQLNQLYPGENLIPVFNGYDAGSVLLEAADNIASTSPKVDIIAVECRNNPASA
jgi:Ca2+-binding RTX toxin-like protein